MKLIVLLVSLVLIGYLGSLSNGITNWDDEYYIFKNDLVQNGFSTGNIIKIFSEYVAGNYHPLTIASLTLDYSLFGNNAAGYHFVNLLFHILNCVLVFYFSNYLLKKSSLAFFVALLFGLHPMHVESVAWISERKDVLYVFFLLLSLIKYCQYTIDHIDMSKKSNARNNYALAFVFFILSLFSKGQAVVLPVLFLIVDYINGRKKSWSLLIDKLPFLALSLVFGLVAIKAQQSTEALQLKSDFSFIERSLIASYGICEYLFMFFLPFGLSCFYPYDIITGEDFPLKYFISAAIVVAMVVATVIWYKKQKKIEVGGILFFFACILPVSQLIPVGQTIIAERYTYLAYIGISVFLVKVMSGWFSAPQKQANTYWVLGFFCVFLGILTIVRCQVWKSSITLWTDVIDKYSEADVAYCNRGMAYAVENRTNEAFNDFSSAIKLNPGYTEALNNRGLIFFNVKKDNKRSIEDYTNAIISDSMYFEAYNNRGVSFAVEKKFDAAVADFTTGISLKPDFARAFYNRGNAYLEIGKKKEAEADLQKAITLYGQQGDKEAVERAQRRLAIVKK